MSPTRLLVAVALLAAACSHPSRPAVEAPTPASASGVEIANQSPDRIDVYLVAETQDRLLGRVEPMTRARLALPRGLESASASMIRLAVVAGGGYTVSPSRDARAVLTLKQPLAALAAQEWVFANGSLTALGRQPRR